MSCSAKNSQPEKTLDTMEPISQKRRVYLGMLLFIIALTLSFVFLYKYNSDIDADDEVDHSSTGITSELGGPRELPTALTHHKPISNSEFAFVSRVPSEVKPEIGQVARLELPEGLRGRYWLAPWRGTRKKRKKIAYFCLYIALDGDESPSTQCFDSSTYSDGMAFASMNLPHHFELVGFTPDPDSRIVVQIPGGKGRLRVRHSVYSFSSNHSPRRLDITTFGRSRSIELDPHR